MVGIVRGAARRGRSAWRALTGRPAAPGAAVRPATTNPLPKRTDPIPPARPFPDALYIVAVGGLPRNFAGRTSSIFAKGRLFKQLAGVDTIALTFNHSSELDDVTHLFRERGSVIDGMTTVNLLDHMPDDTSRVGPPLSHELDEPGMHPIKDPDQDLFRFYDAEGVYRLYKRFDYAGRLIVRDWFTENRNRTRRDEFRLDGTIRRTVSMDLVHNKPRQDIYYRKDGTPHFNLWRGVDDETRLPYIERVTLFDAEGRPSQVLGGYEEILHACLDNFLDGRRAFICTEGRDVDQWMLSYQRPNVKRLFLLHNTHIRPPYDNIKRIRPTYEGLFEHRHDVDATIFLTDTQRAEVEAVYGRQPNYYVVPHAAPDVKRDPSVERDPNLVIMMARLDQQKQLDHALQAWQRVQRELPDARLQIYGRGPLLTQLQAEIKRLKLGRSVTLAGFTTDPHSVYRRAALCIMTSRFEGAPLTLLESFALGCPVVSYDLRYGPADMIDDGVNGFLVPYGDRKAMAAAIVRCLTEPGLLERLSAGTERTSEQFTPETFVARWSGLYNDLDAQGWS